MILFKKKAILKLLLLIPVVWICSLIFFAATSNNQVIILNSHLSNRFEFQNDLNQRVADAMAQHPKVIQTQPKLVQGFGAPIEPEPAAPVVEEPENNHVEDEQPGGNLAKPKFMVDPNDPIYKKGDASQAGELGKAVNIDKTVSFT